MRALLLFFVRFGSILLFVGLEVVCFFLIVNYNKHQRDIYLNSTNLLAGEMQEAADQWVDFLHLSDINDSLSVENARLRKMVINLSFPGSLTERNIAIGDSSLQYDMIPAAVVNQTIHLRNNYLTINKGTDDGITPGMGVISSKGLVGIVKNTSSSYARVISLLNRECRISARIARTNHFGGLTWTARDPNILTLEDVPIHAPIEIGDTIVTSGFSTIFPKELYIGTIQTFDIERGSSSYTIDVRTDNDMSQLNYVNVILNIHAEEQRHVEADL